MHAMHGYAYRVRKDAFDEKQLSAIQIVPTNCEPYNKMKQSSLTAQNKN